MGMCNICITNKQTIIQWGQDAKVSQLHEVAHTSKHAIGFSQEIVIQMAGHSVVILGDRVHGLCRGLSGQCL